MQVSLWLSKIHGFCSGQTIQVKAWTDKNQSGKYKHKELIWYNWDQTTYSHLVWWEVLIIPLRMADLSAKVTLSKDDVNLMEIFISYA